MVEGTGFCDFKFETIAINGQTYRVPVQNNKSLGKVIGNATPALQHKNNGQAPGRREDRGQRFTFTHFISVPIQDPKITDRYDQIKEQILAQKFPGINNNTFNPSA